MLIIGTFDWPKTLESGEFYCPHCDSPRNFRRRTYRPFLTLYFIPIIPIGGKQEYVECTKCKGRFPRSVLGDGNSTGPHSFTNDLLTVLALTILSDGHVTENEIAKTLDVQRVIGQSQLSREELASACAEARRNPISLSSYLWNGRSRWNRQEKISMVQAIFLVSSADGQIPSNRLTALAKTQQILDLSTQEFENCIVQAEQLSL